MLTDDQTERLIRDIRTGRYSLLLGAGASFGGKNKQGIALPLGGSYAAELADLKKVPTTTPLQRVFALLNDAERQTLVIDRFTGCTPSAALEAIPTFIWKRIFSLNIDDALQAAYANPRRLQDFVTRNYRDAFEEAAGRASVPLIHIHGWVGKANEGFIFSRDEYLRQLRHINPWMVLLAESLAIDPFAIMGTALDEFDLEYYLSMRTPVTARPDRGPSILVSTNDDAITRHDCDKYDLAFFHGTSQDFMTFLQEAVGERPTPIGLIPSSTKDLFPASVGGKELATFSADFTRVPSSAEPNTDNSNFLLGRAPTWEDLVSQLDVARQQTGPLVTLIESLFTEDRQHAALIYLKDDPGGGKTTILRRIAFDLARSNIPVLLCSALGRVEPKLTASMLDLIDDPLVIIIDNFADQAFAVADTIKAMEKTDVVFLVTERAYRDRYILQALNGINVIRRNGADLSQREADALLQNYSDAGFLGDRAAVRDADRFADKLIDDPVAVACCRIMNDFRPLDGIITSLIAQGNNTEIKRFAIAALAQHCINGGLRESLVVSSSGAIGLKEQLRPNHHLPLTISEIVEGSRFVTPLNATIGQRSLMILARDKPDALLDAFVSLAKSVAPRVNRQAIRRRSPEARLAGRLFDFDEVTEKFLGANSIKFYSAVQEDWKWNSRYWEQVALLHLSTFQTQKPGADGWEQLDLAVRYARHAVVIEKHPLTLTTLGKVLLAQMLAPGVSAPGAFKEAFDRLDEAIGLEKAWLRSNAQPYVTLFRGVRDYLSMNLELTPRQVQKLNDHAGYARGVFAADQELGRIIDEAEALSRR